MKKLFILIATAFTALACFAGEMTQSDSALAGFAGEATPPTTALAGFAGETAHIDSLLSIFAAQPSVTVANAILDRLDAEGITDQHYHFSNGATTDTLRQQVLYWSAEYYYAQQRYDQAMNCGQEALPLFHGDNSADCLNLLAITCIRLGNSSQAANYAKQCYELDLKSGDPDNISSSLNTLTAIYLGANLPQEAEQYVLAGINYSRQANNAPRLATLHGMASEVYHALGDQQKAYDYALEAYHMEQQMGRASQAAMRLSQMAAALTGLNRQSETKSCLQQAIPQFEADGNLHSLGISCNKMGELMLWEAKPDSAAPYFARAADIFKQMGDLYNEMHSQLGLFNALKDSDPEAAMYKLDRYNELKDTIYSCEAAQAMGQVSAEIDNATLRANSDKQHTRARTFIFIAACITLLLLAVILALILTMRRRTRRFVSEFNSLATDLTNLKEQYDSLQQQDDVPAEQDKENADAEPMDDADRQFKEKLDRLVDRQIEEGHIDVATLASEMCMSISTFRRRFTAIIGERPQAYVIRIRMEKAKHLISQDSNATIAEIAARLGFDDKSNFTRTFKRVVGITPSEYTQKIKKETE